MRIVIITKISVKRKITLLFSQAIPWTPIFGPFTNNGMSQYYFNIKLVLLFSSSGTSIALFLRYCKYANLHNYKDSLNSMEWFYQSCADKIFQYSIIMSKILRSKVKWQNCQKNDGIRISCNYEHKFSCFMEFYSATSNNKGRSCLASLCCDLDSLRQINLI